MRLLIVEDSALMRRVLRENFADQDMEIAFARDGEDALDKLETFQPDVITLDINMPKMDGLTCLAHIMDIRPCPVIMLSSLTEKGAAATFEALELGAVDFVAKPDGTVSVDMSSVMGELRRKIRAATRSRPRASTRATRQVARSAPKPEPTPASARSADRKLNLARAHVELLLIGSSTGGPGAVQHILEEMPAGFPIPILIAQHMPPKFTAAFSKRLDEACDIEVIEVSETMPLQRGAVYLAQGGKDVVVSRKFNRLVAEPVPSDERYTWHPSVSRMVDSALEHINPRHLIGVMLTGMGDDGSVEMAKIHQQGGVTIAESEETAPVFGMPAQLIEQNGATCVLPVDRISEQLLRWSGDVAPVRRSRCS